MDAKDERLHPVRDFTLKCFQLDPEKWQEFVGEKNNRIILGNFFDKPDFPSLFICLDTASNLAVSLNFPRNIQIKAVHFTKREAEVLTKDGMRTVTATEVPEAALDAVITATEEVVCSLLGSSSWPVVVAEDMSRHVQQLKNEALEVKGRVQGRTFLPLPGNSDALEDAAGRAPCQADRKWLHALDSVIIEWAEQVSELLQQDSAQPILDGLKPLPQEEFDFWNKRLLNLQCVHTQLMSHKARKLCYIVEKTESMYWPILRNIYRDVEEGLKEAEDIVLHLTPLQKILQDVQHRDYCQLKASVAAVLHTVCLLWSRSHFYCRPCRIVPLLQEVCNLFISMTRKFLRPEEVLQGLMGQTAQTLARVRLSIHTLQELRASYSLHRAQLHRRSTDGNCRSWDFPSHLVFCHLDAFLQRLHTIQEVYCVSEELYQLEGAELPGSGGGDTTNMVLCVYKDFLQSVKVLAESQCDPTDTQDQGFQRSLRTFQLHVTDCETRLGSALCRAVDDSAAPEAAVKLLQMFSFILARPLIQQQLRPHFCQLVQMLSGELDRAGLLLRGLQDTAGSVGKNMPPAAGRLRHAHQLRERVQLTMKSFRAIQHLCPDSEEVQLLQQKCDVTLASLREFCQAVLSDWSLQADTLCQSSLQQPVIVRGRDGPLRVNFTQQLVELLREASCLSLQGHTQTCTCTADLIHHKHTWRRNVCNLELLVSCYNQARSSEQVDLDLIQQQLQNVDLQLNQLLNLSWSCEGSHLIQQTTDRLCEFHSRLSQARANMAAMMRIIQGWSEAPLFTHGEAESLLDEEGGASELDRRYEAIRASGEELHRLTQENRKLYEADGANEAWIRYVDHIDGKVLDGLFRLVSVSLHFLSDNMNPESSTGVLFSVSLQLDGETVFQPSLVCSLPERLHTLLTAAYTAAGLIHTLSPSRVHSYQLELQQEVQLLALAEQVRRRLQEVQEEAEHLREQLDRYAYLWQDDRQEVMQQFLSYGRALTSEELEAEGEGEGSRNLPTLQDFRKEIESYDRLHGEVSRLDDRVLLHGWLQVDLRPFRSSLLSIIQSWSSMFKQHLVNCVTHSLQQLQAHQVQEESQAAAASRFPLRETIVMLEASGVQLPDEVYAQLQWQ